MASHLQHNNTDYTNDLAQLLVRDFGTHYITTVDAGAILAKVDHLRSSIYGVTRGTFFQGHRIVALTAVRATI